MEQEMKRVFLKREAITFFFRTLLEREATSEYLNQNYPRMVKDVHHILAGSETVGVP